jgi:hypothetical protein
LPCRSDGRRGIFEKIGEGLSMKTMRVLEGKAAIVAERREE